MDPFIAMWGTRKLSSSGNLFLGVFKSGCWGTQAGCSRFTTSAGKYVWRFPAHSPPRGPAIVRRRGQGGGLSLGSLLDLHKTLDYFPSDPRCPLNGPSGLSPFPSQRLGKIAEDLCWPRRAQSAGRRHRSCDFCLILVEFLRS